MGVTTPVTTSGCDTDEESYRTVSTWHLRHNWGAAGWVREPGPIRLRGAIYEQQRHDSAFPKGFLAW